MRRVLGALLIGGLAVGCARTPETNGEARHIAGSEIVGGTTTQAAQWDGLIQTENDSQGAWCGATLIAADWAVSAAHCYIDTMPLGGFQRVVLGRTNTSAGGGETIDTDQAFIHEAYDADTHQNDIALIHLSKKSTHAPVRLATPDDWAALNSANTNVTVVGWGTTQEGGSMSDALRQVTVPVVPTTQCNSEYGNIITDSQICAGLQNGGKDACQGDSGGPLFANQNGQRLQVGIVSFGQGCAQANFAGVYTSVASFRDWIDTKTNGAVPANDSPVPNDNDAPSTDSPTTDDAPAQNPTSTTSTAGDDDDSTSTKTTPTKKKKKSSSSDSASAAPDPQIASTGCTMSGGATKSDAALVVLFALVAFGARRRFRS
jgi:MYXO-CTERM domain-containing protein